MDLKTETLGLALDVELPMVIVRHPAGRAVDRHADQDRAGRPAEAMYGRHGEAPIPIIAACTPADCFIDRVRSGPHRHQVHDAGDPADRRLPGQRRGAVADPELRRPARLPVTVPHRPAGLLPVRPRREDAGAALGAPGHARPRASDRRPRQGVHHRQRELRAAQPRADGPAARAQGGGHHARDSADRGLRSARGRPAGRRLGQHLRRAPAGGARSCERGAPGRPRPSASPEPAARRPRRHPRARSEGPGPRDQPGSAGARPARRVSGRRDRIQEDPGPTVQGVRDGQPLQRLLAGEGRHEAIASAVRSSQRTSSPIRTCAGVPAAATTPSCAGAEAAARARRAARELRVHLGHRLLEPLPVLRQHLRLPLHPWPRAGHRDRAEGLAPRAVGLGGHRRRRRACRSAATT